MGTVGQHTPNWLSEGVFNDTFDWTKSIKTTFPTFFEYVTLHDSSWQAINLNVTNETILSIEFDAFWNKEYTMKTENADEWPYLIIKIPIVFNVSYNTVEFATTIVDTSSVIINPSEIEKLIGPLTDSQLLPKEFYDRLIGCKELHKTRFDDVYGGNIEFLHDREIFVLLIEEKGQYIDPTLEKVIPFDKRVPELKNEKGIASKLWNKLTGK